MLSPDKGYRERLQNTPLPKQIRQYDVGDREAAQLFYTIRSPVRPFKGVPVLLPGTRETV